MASFPQEIIENILTRLPVKSLSRFKCVSKPWLSLISSKRFIKSHLQLYSPNSARIIAYQNLTHLHFSAHTLISERVPEPTQQIDDFGAIIGSCNGLVLILVGDIMDRNFYIFNPCTGNSKILPPVNVDGVCWGVYGIGYIESKDDYVVIGILSMNPIHVIDADADVDVDVGEYESQVIVYSCRTNSWKNIGDFMYVVSNFDVRCKFVAGKFHLCTCSLDSIEPSHPLLYDIVSIDLEHEVCGMIEQPCYGDGDVQLSLEVYGGSLCVLSSKVTNVDVWVMKEYGVEASWCKTVTIPYFFNNPRDMYSKLLNMSSSGEISLLYRSRIVVYDPKDNCLKVPGTRDLGEFQDADVYHESLVWPTQDE